MPFFFLKVNMECALDLQFVTTFVIDNFFTLNTIDKLKNVALTLPDVSHCPQSVT
jgi:hypothetical protein